MSRLAELERAYTHIFTDREPIVPLGDVIVMSRELQPNAAEIAALSSQCHPAEYAISTTRSASIVLRGGEQELRFARNGICIMGDDEGIIAVDAVAGETDPVARHYGPYHHVALGKLGIGAFSSRLADRYPAFTERYAAVDHMLDEHGLKAESGVPHHLGYAFASSSGGVTVAAASGMLATPAIAASLAARHAGQIERDRERGWLTWEGDETCAGDTFAGYHDLAFASNVLAQYRDSSRPAYTAPPIAPLAAAGVNLH
jgi:hypothetical protein